MGGKVLKNLGKSATHLVWANGKLKTLLKASELNLQIVSPLGSKHAPNKIKLSVKMDIGLLSWKRKLSLLRINKLLLNSKRKEQPLISLH